MRRLPMGGGAYAEGKGKIATADQAMLYRAQFRRLPWDQVNLPERVTL